MWLLQRIKRRRLAKKILNSMQELKSAILAIFQTGPEWPCPISMALNNPSKDFKKKFLFCFEFLAMLEGKFRSSPFLGVQYCKMTVCIVTNVVRFLQTFFLNWSVTCVCTYPLRIMTLLIPTDTIFKQYISHVHLQKQFLFSTTIWKHYLVSYYNE